jgi:hypothetical protein
VKSLTKIGIDDLCPRGRYVDTHLSHRNHGLRVQPASLRSGAYDLEFLASQRAQKCFRHLSTAGVLRAKE